MTKILKASELDLAASIIKNGGIVAFPTETVYGLGANAFSSDAVKKIYKAKGRPSDNPMIVHIADKADIFKVAREVPQRAKLLMAKYWPGPLTIVLKKSKLIPDEVTGGLDTVAIRMPNSKVALSLIKKSGVPIAAPSANLSGRPSPTMAQHVIDDLEGKIDAVIDGGSAKVGLESTVVDMTVSVPVLLRPGKISKEELEGFLGMKVGVAKKNSAIRSPGMKYKHYSPKCDLILIEKGNTHEIIEKYKKKGFVSLITMHKDHCKNAHITVYFKNNETMAAHLFESLRDLESRSKTIIVEGVDRKGIGSAIMNRLEKAASKIL